ncbi:MAG: bifunctional folylpolyglutamate synthase/dihydrofolate synthase [Chlamydiota bacterium]
MLQNFAESCEKSGLADSLKYLLALNPLKSTRWDLIAMRRMADLLGNPQNDYRSVHIAGTNGKGSVARKIAATLSAAGYRVGCFTSPHIACYRERITINGQKILEEELNQWLSELFALTKREQLTNRFFELTTLVAFIAFSRCQVDLAVIETGIGGRLDPTNIICPIATVITTVDFDHCKLLGHSLDAIAIEKGGIIKEKTPVILGPRADFPSIVSMAKVNQAPLYPLTDLCELDSERENQAIAAQTLEVIAADFPVRPEHLAVGMAATLPCRFEIERNVIYDVAHNPAAFQRLFVKIKRLFPNRPIHLILAFSKEKEVKWCLDQILANIADLYLVVSDHPRLLKAVYVKRLVEMRIAPGLSGDFLGNIHVGENDELVALAKRQAKLDEGVILVAGSFYIMEAVKKAFRT